MLYGIYVCVYMYAHKKPGKASLQRGMKEEQRNKTPQLNIWGKNSK